VTALEVLTALRLFHVELLIGRHFRNFPLPRSLVPRLWLCSLSRCCYYFLDSNWIVTRVGEVKPFCWYDYRL